MEFVMMTKYLYERSSRKARCNFVTHRLCYHWYL